MKKTFLLATILSINLLAFSQTDTISYNIYQNSGNFGIGTTNPTSIFELKCNTTITYPSFGILSIKNNHYATFDGFAASDIDDVSALINGRRSRGTLDYPENVQKDDRITGIVAGMYYNNQFRFNSSIIFRAGEGLGYNSYPSYIVFNTTDKYESSKSERMRLTESGFLGIGTKEPASKLQVKDGDIFIEDISRGIIMKSPNGSCWKGVLDDFGNLNFTLIDCPCNETTYSSKCVESQNKIIVIPNPANKNLTVNISKNVNYEIITLNGQVIKNGKIKYRNPNIDISRLKNGMYILNIYNINNELIASEKVIKN